MANLSTENAMNITLLNNIKPNLNQGDQAYIDEMISILSETINDSDLEQVGTYKISRNNSKRFTELLIMQLAPEIIIPDVVKNANLIPNTNNILRPRDKKANEELEDYEAYLEKYYKDKGVQVTFGANGKRNPYPHEGYDWNDNRRPYAANEVSPNYQAYLNSNLVGNRLDANGNRLPNQPAHTQGGQQPPQGNGQTPPTNGGQTPQGGTQNNGQTDGYINPIRGRHRYRMRSGFTNATSAIKRIDSTLGSSSTWKNIWQIVKKPLCITLGVVAAGALLVFLAPKLGIILGATAKGFAGANAAQLAKLIIGLAIAAGFTVLGIRGAKRKKRVPFEPTDGNDGDGGNGGNGGNGNPNPNPNPPTPQPTVVTLEDLQRSWAQRYKDIRDEKTALEAELDLLDINDPANAQRKQEIEARLVELAEAEKTVTDEVIGYTTIQPAQTAGGPVR